VKLPIGCAGKALSPMHTSTSITLTLREAAKAIANRPAASREAESANQSDARLDAEVLLAHVLDQSRSWLYAHSDAIVEKEDLERFGQLLTKRINGVPVAILTGHQEFWSLPLQVSSDVLVPRPETEQLVEVALANIGSIRSPRILELGTGSGAIAIALACERPDAEITATDLSTSALAVASANAGHISKTQQHFPQIRFIESDWFSALIDPANGGSQQFDLIVSNPPYLASDDPHLQGDIRHEPRSALVSGPKGLDALSEIISVAPDFLPQAGRLILEHGATQAQQLHEMLQGANYTCIETCHDLAGLARITTALAG